MAISAEQPLSHFPVLHTSSLDEACDVVTRFYLPHALTPVGSTQLDASLNAYEGRSLTVGYLTYHADTKLTMPPAENTYHINLTTVGTTYASRQDGARAITEAEVSGLVLLPNQRTTVTWAPDAEQFILKVPRARLESHLADLIGRPVKDVINFDFSIDFTTPQGRSLLASVQFLARELDRPGGIAEMPLAREELETFTLSQLLIAARNPYVDELTRPAEACASAD
ncbi:cupin domain-containing protein [Streptomyces rhizosphaericus]|uniref:cupin domain-containing protein n=1 Tax=Streptomyces rhizosphaericus TaxID=114699 RepID=UPI0019D2BFAB|nr:hypothetical protein [Streptomyces rhizosphaericus]